MKIINLRNGQRHMHGTKQVFRNQFTQRSIVHVHFIYFFSIAYAIRYELAKDVLLHADN